MPRLSVIMPVRNGLPELASAIRSVLVALPADSELVVYDDGSDDGTADMLDGYARRERRRSRSVRWIAGAESIGVARGLNRLLAAVDSEFVGRLDADDMALPWRFAHQLRAMRRGVDMSFATVIDFGSAIRPHPPVHIGADAFRLHLLLRNPVTHSTMFGRTDLIRAIGAYRTVPAEDYDLWMRLAASGARMERLGLPGALYRVHDKQITATADWKSAARNAPSYEDSYQELAHAVLGMDATWFRAWRRLDPIDETDRTRTLLPLRAAIEERASSLSWLERRVLRAALDDRLGR